MKFLLFMIPLILISSYIKAESKHVRAIDKTTGRFIKEMKKEKKLSLYGYGGRMMNDIKEVSLSFASTGSANIDEARLLYVDIAEKYLKRVNSDEKLRPYLHNYPFDINNLELTLSFFDENRKRSLPIAFVFYGSKRGVLIYDTYDHQAQKLITVHEEPYAEALKIVTGQRQHLNS